MTRKALIEKTIQTISHLPDEKVQEISDFADFINMRYEESLIMAGIQKIVEKGTTFEFLNNDEDLYSEADIKSPYNG